jgi:SecD/SecF fusion protein
VASNVWSVAINIGRESDAKLVLDALQADYNGKPYFPTISGVGGQIAAQTQWRALAAIIASLIGIVMYVWIRFQNVAFGFGAVVALIHDVLVALAAIAVSYWLAPFFGFAQVETFRISLPIIAAFLTLIGYSINDTIVVFDRIREVRGKRPELTEEMINISVSQTLARTILTTTLTLLAVLVLYLFGGESIHGFAYCLLIGMIAGTYSTIFIASPVALWLFNKMLKPKTAKKPS